MSASLFGPLVASILIAAVARHYNVSAPLVLVVVGLFVGLIPTVPEIVLQPDLVLFVILPPLLWSAGLEASYINMRRNVRSIGLLAVGLPLVTTVTVGFVAYCSVPSLTMAAALTLGAVVAPPDAVSATAVGRRLGLPRRLMTLLGGESLLNDATALTAYKVALAAAIGATVTWQQGLAVFALAAVGGIAVGVGLGATIAFIRWQLADPLMESSIGLVAPFVVYLVAEEIHGSGVLAVVVAALLLGQRFTHAHYAIRLQDQAVWRAVQLVLESFAFLLIGLQLPTVIADLRGIPSPTLLVAAVAVLGTVIGVRLLWVSVFAYLPRWIFPHIRRRESAPSAGQTFILAWAGMRGVVSLAAAFGVPLATLNRESFPGRAQLIFLTFVVVVGTLLLHGLTLPWLIGRLGLGGEQARSDAIAVATARDQAALAAARRLDEILADTEPSPTVEHAADALRGWNTRRRNAARERLRRNGSAGDGDDITTADGEDPSESSSTVFRWMRLEMLVAERTALIAERDCGHIDDEVLRTALHSLDLEEAALNLD